MDDSARLQLPYMLPAQAQKHVTVNEALVRLDGAVNLVLASVTVAIPPETVQDGMVFGVPVGAVNAWAGQEGKVAIGSNGGWIYLTPQFGWRAFIRDQGGMAIHDGEGWAVGAATLSGHGAGLRMVTNEIDHVVVAGTTNTTAEIIPPAGMVIGVTARVIEPISGTLTSWSLGSGGAADRFGSGLGMAADSWVKGMLGQPMTYWNPEGLVLTATGGSFAAGRVRFAAHYLELALPRS